MTQLTKLGDVAAYLRAGDSFRFDGWSRTLVSASGELIQIRENERGARPDWHVELLNPRWERASAFNWGDDDAVRSGDTIMRGADYRRSSGDVVDPELLVLVRDVGELKLAGAESERSLRDAKTEELRVGDIIRLPKHAGKPHLVTGLVTGFDASGCALLSPSGFVWPRSVVTLLSRNNPIPGDTTQPDSLPRLVKGSELRVGDRYRYIACEGLSEWHAAEGNARHPDGAVVGERDKHGDPEWIDSTGNSIVQDTWTVELLSRAEPVYEPASQPEAPALDTDRLRREWEYLAERTPWDAMAGIYESRQWECSPFVQDTVPLSWELRLAADDLFYRALKDPRLVAEGARMLVVLQPDNRDRPIELFAEALNAVAYHAKIEELWPNPVAKPELRKACVTCGAMCGGGRIRCGDCLMAMDKRTGVLVGHVGRMHDPENRFRGLPPAPGVRLSPGARYHLADDADAFGIPEHN